MLSSNPVFVVGMFRSGTSLLYSLLNQHSQISLMYECDAWDFPHTFAPRRLEGDWLARQEFYNQALSRHRLIYANRLNGLEKVRTPDDLYRCHGAQRGAKLWGEKSPVYATRLTPLAQRYPQGSFILIWRDPVEIYRSIKVAGRKSTFFRRPGTLHRLIYHQEQMIRDASQIERAGARVKHVNYDRLVDQTPAVCRELCEFLRVEFEPDMASLKKADFSAVYPAPQHDFLRRGIIERQPPASDAVAPAEAQKLCRFRQRWERIGGRPLSLKGPPSTPEPAATEVVFHQAAGTVFQALDDGKRLAFEFLPFSWLRTYRRFRHWLRTPDSSEPSLFQVLRQDGATVVVGMGLLALVGWFDYATGPDISCGPFYLLPCALLTLIVGRRWGTLAAVASTISITMFREGSAHHYHGWLTATVTWKMAMRFVFFQLFVLLLDRIRRDLALQENQAENPES